MLLCTKFILYIKTMPSHDPDAHLWESLAQDFKAEASQLKPEDLEKKVRERTGRHLQEILETE